MFKVGDRVECVNAYPYLHIQNGRIYTVLEVGRDGFISIGTLDPWDPDRFRLVEEDPKDVPRRNCRPAPEPGDTVHSDPVNSPSHYVRGGFELIDVLEAWDLTPAMYSAVCYIMRAKFKGTELQDLKKARWYLDREIRKLEAGGAK